MFNQEEKMESLLYVLEYVDLDFNWLLSAVSLSIQEIAVKRKLDELGEPYGEEDFQKLADNLIKIMEEKGIEPPHILLSIVRSYRHIRAKIMHDPQARLSTEEAEAIFNNTVAFIKTLFPEESKTVNVHEFIDSIVSSSVDKKSLEFNNFNEITKKQVFESILEKIAILDWQEVEAHKKIFDFLGSALKIETNTILQEELFEMLLRRTLIIEPLKKAKLLPIIAEFTQLSHIKKLIKQKGLVNPILNEYESSSSFIIAASNAEIVLHLTDILNEEEINKVVEAALSNDQITYSWDARTHLKKFLSLCPDRISKEKAKKLEEVLKEKSPFQL